MKKTKHTKGPWSHYHSKLRSISSSPMIHEIHGPNGERIVHWGGLDGCDLSKPTINANCDLIAAAPELLEALQNMIVVLESYDHISNSIDTALNYAQMAVLKATDPDSLVDNDPSYLLRLSNSQLVECSSGSRKKEIMSIRRFFLNDNPLSEEQRYLLVQWVDKYLFPKAYKGL